MFSTSTLFSAYASITGSIMLIQSLTNQLIPPQLQTKILSKIHHLFNPLSSQLTLVIEEFEGLTPNEIYKASEIFLATKITSSVKRLRVVKLPRDKNHSLKIHKGEEITDIFQGIQLKWKFISLESIKPDPDDTFGPQQKSETRSFELKFHKSHKDQVLESYLPYVLNTSKSLKDKNKVVKLHTIGGLGGDQNGWGSINLEHPATFDTLAMDQKLKNEIIDDLQRFMKRKEFYKTVGKAWKRGYLLYGPPGTGKSSLIAAIANYLKFDVYDMELASVYNNSMLRKFLVSTANRSILVIEDIDCSADLSSSSTKFQNFGPNDKVTLSGLLNFIDGLWSSCGDERIIIFTTNHKDRLDPALLRPGRMDKHIHMSYCTTEGFNILAANYLGVHKENKNKLYLEIEDQIEKSQVTPAEVAEELMKTEDVNIALGELVECLKRKRKEWSEAKENNDETQKHKRKKSEAEDVKGTNGVRRGRVGKGRCRR
ncbi:hypothetical protein ACHQM5_027560 [Ranunculus cassubicifolius]